MKIHLSLISFFFIFLIGSCECFDWRNIAGSVKGFAGKAMEKAKEYGEKVGPTAEKFGKRMKNRFDDLMEKAKQLPEKARLVIDNFSNSECWNVDIYSLDVTSCEFKVDFQDRCKTLHTNCSLQNVVGGGKCSVEETLFEIAKASSDIEIRMESIKFVKKKVLDCEDEEFKREVEMCHAELDKDPEIELKGLSGASDLILTLAKESGFYDMIVRKTSSVLESKMCDIIDGKFFQDGGRQIVNMIQTDLATTAINNALASQSSSFDEEIIEIPINLKAFGFSKNVGSMSLKNLRSRIHLKTGYFGMKGKMMKADLEMDQIEVHGVTTIAGYDASVSIIFHGMEMSTVVDADYQPYATNCYFSLNDVEISADIVWDDSVSVTQSILKATQYLLGVIKFEKLIQNYVQKILEENVCLYFENEVVMMLESRLGGRVLGEDEL